MPQHEYGNEKLNLFTDQKLACMNLGRYRLVWVVFGKTMLNSYSHENCGLLLGNQMQSSTYLALRDRIKLSPLSHSFLKLLFALANRFLS